MNGDVGRWLRLTACGAVILLAACSEGVGEDRPATPGSGAVEVLGGLGSVSVSGVVEGYGEELYEPSTDQSANLAVGADLRDLRAIMSTAVGGNAVDWAAALAIFENGQNGPQSIAEISGDDPIAAVIRDGLTGEGHAAGLADNSRRLIVDRGVQGLMYRRALEHLDAAQVAMDGGDAEDAAAEVDAAWAFVSGERDLNGAPNNGLLATGLSREENFLLQGRVARPLEASLFQALVAAQQGTDEFDEFLDRSRDYLNTILYLSVLRNAKVLEATTRASDREAQLAESWAFFQAIHPQVEAASPDSASVIEEAYSRSAEEAFPASLTEAVYAALNDPAVLDALRIPDEFRFTSPAQ